MCVCVCRWTINNEWFGFSLPLCPSEALTFVSHTSKANGWGIMYREPGEQGGHTLSCRHVVKQGLKIPHAVVPQPPGARVAWKAQSKKIAGASRRRGSSPLPGTEGGGPSWWGKRAGMWVGVHSPSIWEKQEKPLGKVWLLKPLLGPALSIALTFSFTQAPKSLDPTATLSFCSKYFNTSLTWLPSTPSWILADKSVLCCRHQHRATES